MEIDVMHIAKLAKLRFSDDESAMLEEQMGGIIAMIGNLPEIEGEPAYTISGITQLRADKPAQELSRDELLANAPAKQAGCFVVPKTLKGE